MGPVPVGFFRKLVLHVGSWRRLKIRGLHQSKTSGMWEKARHSKYTSQDVGGYSQALVTAPRVTNNQMCGPLVP